MSLLYEDVKFWFDANQILLNSYQVFKLYKSLWVCLVLACYATSKETCTSNIVSPLKKAYDYQLMYFLQMHILLLVKVSMLQKHACTRMSIITNDSSQ